MADPGTALAIASLAFQMVAGCVQGFNLLCSARDIGKVGSGLICSLAIQEVRLIDWADRVGLLRDTPVLDVRLNAALIQTVLGQLDGLLGDVEKLSIRYKFALSKQPTVHQAEQEIRSKSMLMSHMMADARRDSLLKAKLVRSSNSFPKQLLWAAVDEEKFKDLVHTIQTLVQELWGLLDPLTHDDMMRKIDRLLVHTISQSQDIGDVQALQAAITMDDSSAGRREQQSLLANLAGLRGTRIQAGDLSDIPAQEVKGVTCTPARDSILDFEKVTDFRGMDDDKTQGMAKYNGQDCFVEFRTTPEDTTARTIIVNRARNLTHFLTALKHSAFYALNCMGVAISPDSARLYFVFQLPSSGSRPVTLNALLSLSQGSLPSVTARVRLAKRLVAAMQYTHAAGWLHRNIRSTNIVFFLHEEPIRSFEITTSTIPYVTGFAYARLDSAEFSEAANVLEPANDIYRHPTLLQEVSQRSQPYMDVYSLGTILLELGTWLPLRRMLKSIVDVRSSQVNRSVMAGIAPFLTKNIHDTQGSLNLPYRMGSIYADATSLCLGVSQMEAEDSLRLLEDVVNSLGRCRI